MRRAKIDGKYVHPDMLHLNKWYVNIQFDVDNDCFADNMEAEIRKLLEKLPERIALVSQELAEYDVHEYVPITLMDSMGNTVGVCRVGRGE